MGTTNLQTSIKLCLVLIVGAILGYMIRLSTISISMGELTINNKTGKQIKEIEIQICENKFWFWDFSSGSAIKFAYPIDCESGYRIKVTPASGEKFESSVGYVTRGYDFSDSIDILKDSIKLDIEKSKIR